MIGTGLTLAYLITRFVASVFSGENVMGEAHYLLLILVVVGVGTVFAVIAATFIASFYLLVFGMPVAALMRNKLRGPIGIAITVAVALFAASVFMGVFSVAPERWFDLNWEGAAMILAYALPAGFLYRKTVLSLLEELD